ncbi:MAG TPA: DUF5689 domain-containing protein, partial [Bacteroidales bacterium]|nr:DUF5689 domain-containing protein [Bacteroidales bacterium]
YDMPPVKQIPIGEIYTIQQIKDSLGSAANYQFKNEASVYATVTMDNETDNSYRTFYLQDNTAAIAVYQDVSGGVYIGDSVRIYLKDLVVMKYSELFQINTISGGGINVDTSLIKQGFNRPRTPEVATIDQINSNKAYYQGRLVKIENIQFVDTDTSKTFANAADLETENRYIQDASDKQLIVRTSGYSTLASGEVPNGSGSIIAIVGQYNSDMQLYIRKLSEVDMNGERFTVGGGGGTGEGTGTKEDPYNVAGAIANNTGLKQWVKGYIVGAAEYITGTGNVFHFESPFGSVTTNLFIADDPNESNPSNVFVVQLPSGEIRNILNLIDHPTNHKKQVMVRGNLESYFGQPGMKETIGCIIDDTEYGETSDVDAILFEDFATITRYGTINLTGWNVIAETGTVIWQGDGYNGQSAEISAFESGEASNISWLITPAVDLSATTSPYLSFYSALKYFAGDILSVHVSTDYDGGDSPQTATWTELTAANIVSTSDPVDDASGYNYTDSGNVDLSAYKYSSVYIAFKYSGSGNNNQTTKYRVDNIKIAEL